MLASKYGGALESGVGTFAGGIRAVISATQVGVSELVGQTAGAVALEGL